MNDCQSIREDLDAYQDGMLDTSYHQRIESHLGGCDECQRLLHRGVRIGQALSDLAQNHWKPPVALWKRIQHSVDLEQCTRQQPIEQKRKSLRFAMVAILVLTIGLSAVLLNLHKDSPGEAPVATALVNEFHTFVISRRDLDFDHDEPEAIREWFSQKVDFRVPLPQLSSDMQLAGGRLCNLLDQRVASFMYLSKGAWVSLYIMKPVVQGSGQTTDFEQLVQGYGYIKWVHEGLQYSLVGDISLELLRRFADHLHDGQFAMASGSLPTLAGETLAEILLELGYEQI